MRIITKVDVYVEAEPQRIKRHEIFIFTFFSQTLHFSDSAQERKKKVCLKTDLTSQLITLYLYFNCIRYCLRTVCYA